MEKLFKKIKTAFPEAVLQSEKKYVSFTFGGGLYHQLRVQKDKVRMMATNYPNKAKIGECLKLIKKHNIEGQDINGTEIIFEVGARNPEIFTLRIEIPYSGNQLDRDQFVNGVIDSCAKFHDTLLPLINNFLKQPVGDLYTLMGGSASGDATMQQELANAILEKFPDAEVKKINEDNFVDVHLPSVNPKRGTHLFFNTAKQEIKFGFYCRDEEFVNPIVQRSPKLEAYAQGIRLSGNPVFTDIQEAVAAALEFLNEFGVAPNSASNETDITSSIKAFAEKYADELCVICESLLEAEKESSYMYIYDLDFEKIQQAMLEQKDILDLTTADFVSRAAAFLNDWSSLADIVGKEEAEENRKEYETESYSDDSSIAFIYSDGKYVYSFLNKINDSSEEETEEVAEETVREEVEESENEAVVNEEKTTEEEEYDDTNEEQEIKDDKMAARWRNESDERIAELFNALLRLLGTFRNRGENEYEIAYFMVEFERLISEEIILSKIDILNEVREKLTLEWNEIDSIDEWNEIDSIVEWDESDFDNIITDATNGYELLVRDYNLVSELNKSIIRLHCLPITIDDITEYAVLRNLKIPLPVFSKPYSKEDVDEIDSDTNKEVALLSVETKTLVSRFYDAFVWVESLPKRIVVERKSQYGVIDASGRELLPCSYEKIIIVNEQLFWCHTGDTWQLMNDLNNKVLEVQYDLLEKAIDDLFYVKKNDLCGVINLKGEEIIPVVYEAILPFKEDIAPVFENGFYIFYDTKGNKKNLPPVERLENTDDKNWYLENGIMIARINGRYHYLRKDGVIVGGISSNWLLALNNGIAFVKDDNEKYGAMDLSGNLLVPYKYDYYDLISGVTDNLIFIYLDSKCGVINMKDEVIVPFEYDYIYISDIAKIIFCELNGKERLFDYSGNMVMDFYYDDISFNRGAKSENDKQWLKVWKDNKAGFYHLGNKKTIDCIYDSVVGDVFEDGVACITLNNKFGLIDEDGRLLGGQYYDDVAFTQEVTIFQENMSYVKNGDLFAYIDKSGALKTEFLYSSAGHFTNGYAIVSDKNNFYGVINTSFEPMMVFQYQALKSVQSAPLIFIAQKKDRWGVIDIKGNVLVDFIYENIDSAQYLFDSAEKINVVPADDIKLYSKLICVKREKIELNALENQLTVPYRFLKYGIVNSEGKELIPPIYEELDLLAPNLWKVKVEESYGVVNNSNAVVIPAVFSEIDYSDGFLYTTLNELKGVYNTNGSVLIPNEYSLIQFESGYFTVTKNRLDGVYSSTGKKIIPEAYNTIYGYTEGFFILENDSKYRYVNEQGVLLTDEFYDDANPFHDGIALVKKNDQFCLIDKQGQVVMQLDCDGAYLFKFGFSIVNKNDLYGVINRSGQHVLPYEFDNIQIEENCFIVQKGDLDGVYNHQGKPIILPSFGSIGASGAFYVVEKNDVYGLYDNMGNEILPLQYDECTISNSLIQVQKNDQIQLFNPVTRQFLPTAYSSVGEFNEGLASVALDGKYGYINESGQVSIALQFDHADSFKDGRAIIKKDGRYGVIDKHGALIIPNDYSKLTHLDHGYFIVENEKQYRLLNHINQQVVPNSFDKIKEYDPDQKIALFGKYFDASVLVDQKNTFIINQDQHEFTIGYDTNCYVSEDVAGEVSDETFLDALSSGNSWSSYAWDNNWYDMDGIRHTHGIIEPATDIRLSDGTCRSIKIPYTKPDYDVQSDCFSSTSKGDFVQIASSDEKSYGWDQWKKYNITFDDWGNYYSPLLQIDTIVNGIEVKGVFDVRKINVHFDYDMVESYTYEDDGLSFEEDDNYQSSGKGFSAALYFNNGNELVEIDLEELSSELEENSIPSNDIEAIKEYLLKQ